MRCFGLQSGVGGTKTMEEINKQLEQVLAGELSANDAHSDVQAWLRVSVYNLAYCVASHATRAGRAQALEMVKEDQPAFYDDVSHMAKIIFKKSFTA